ncbi:PEP-CTERM sorting domain-containing protein [Kiritimatiellota bacterium B12222]|nr:PEP-CTERM sorting domain-containing protein [Kiritimatiellota bacterium B12222]
MNLIQKLLSIYLLTSTCACSVYADLLVYESFNYTGSVADNAIMNGVESNATGVSGSYSRGGSDFKYSTTGLSFSPNFSTPSGGSVYLNISNSQYGILKVGLDAETVSGDLYHSFLFRSSLLTATGNNNGTFSRIAGDKLSVSPKSKVAEGIGIGYNGSANETADNDLLLENTTYLMLSKFTHVGSTLSAGTPGTATVWALTASEYDNWLSAGGGLEANLSTYTDRWTTQTLTEGTFNVTDSSILELASTTTGLGSGSLYVTYDELRFGTTLSDVVLIPEPSSLLLLSLAGAVALVATRRKQTF